MPITLRTLRDASDRAPIAEAFNAESIADGTEFLRTPNEMAADHRPTWIRCATW